MQRVHRRISGLLWDTKPLHTRFLYHCLIGRTDADVHRTTNTMYHLSYSLHTTWPYNPWIFYMKNVFLLKILTICIENLLCCTQYIASGNNFYIVNSDKTYIGTQIWGAFVYSIVRLMYLLRLRSNKSPN